MSKAKFSSRGRFEGGFARRLQFEQLEDRRVLATFTVTNLSDAAVAFPGNAPGTLRQAVYDANHTAGTDVIQFASNLSGTVNLSIADDTSLGASALVISSAVTIRGNAIGITIGRNTSGSDMRLFKVTAAGSLTLDSLSVTGGVIRGTNATTLGGEGGDAFGGAIFSEATTQIIASTLYGNKAIGGNGGSLGGGASGRGGALYSDGGTVIVTSSTFSGNSAQSGTGSKVASSFGGGLYTRNGSLSIHNSTITNGAATSGRGVDAVADGATATVDIGSSIIGQSDLIPTSREFLTTLLNNGQLVVTGGNNLIRSQGDYQYITVSTDDPLLGPLQNNGGPTMTHALPTDSPALNQGNNTMNFSTDQRGATYTRAIGSAPDIGAFEVQTAVTPGLPGDYNTNQRVDAADYVLWRKTQGTSVGQYGGADGSGNGTVDAADYTVWRSHFGATAGAGLGASAHSEADIVTSQEPSPSTTALYGLVLNSEFATTLSDKPIIAAPASTTTATAQNTDLALVDLLHRDPAQRNTAEGFAIHADDAETPAKPSSITELSQAVWSAWSDLSSPCGPTLR